MCIGHTQVLKYTTEKLRDPTGKTVHATGSIVAGERTRPTQDMFNATSDRWRWIDHPYLRSNDTLDQRSNERIVGTAQH